MSPSRRPGGDVIGRRRVDTHFLALEQLGAVVEIGDDYALSTKGLRGADVFLDEPSVTGHRERADGGEPRAGNDDAPQRRERAARAGPLRTSSWRWARRSRGSAPTPSPCTAARALHGATHRIGPDHIEVGSFIGLAAVTRSELRIVAAGVEHLRSTRMGFERLGIECTVGRRRSPRVRKPEIGRSVSDLGGHVPKLEDQPWPAFPADLMSIAIVTATQCEGLILMHEKMFESRMFFVDKLIGMGARIVLCDPHRALVAGPSALRGSTLESPDIRAGMAMLLAALCATGTSTINNVGQIERGYERIDERLRALGARITRVEDRRA